MSTCSTCGSRLQAHVPEPSCLQHAEFRTVGELSVLPYFPLRGSEFPYLTHLTIFVNPTTSLQLPNLPEFPSLTHIRLAFTLDACSPFSMSWFQANSANVRKVLTPKLKILLFAFQLDYCDGQADGYLSVDVPPECQGEFVGNGEKLQLEDPRVVIVVSQEGFAYQCLHHTWGIAEAWVRGDIEGEMLVNFDLIGFSYPLYRLVSSVVFTFAHILIFTLS